MNFDGADETPVTVRLEDSEASTATFITLMAPSASSVNLSGEKTSIWTETTVTGTGGVFTFTLSNSYISAVLRV